MKVKDLISSLQQLNQESSIMILDGFNGGGSPRDINFGPIPHLITGEDSTETADCEGLVGTITFVIGYGSY